MENEDHYVGDWQPFDEFFQGYMGQTIIVDGQARVITDYIPANQKATIWTEPPVDVPEVED